MTVRINKQKINLREKLTEFEDKVNFDEVVRGLGEYTGNVGIGIQDAQYKFEIAGEGNTFAQIKTLGNTALTSLLFGDQNANANGRVAYNHANNSMELFTAGTAKIHIDSSGNVGIGTTNPDYNLSVVSNTNPAKIGIHGYGSFSDGAVAAQLLFLGKDSNGGNRNLGHIQVREHSHSSGTGSMEFFTRIGGNEVARMTISDDGNVGIGTTNPGYELEVVGDINATVNLRAAGNIITSDDRVKHNEQAIVGAIETLGKITPKKYIKTTEMYEANHDFELDAHGYPVDENGEPVEHSIEAGVIAQQVLEVPELAFMVSPEGVDEDGNVTSPHGLNYNSLFTYAIAAIQEQQSIIEDLKSRIETLESK